MARHKTLNAFYRYLYPLYQFQACKEQNRPRMERCFCLCRSEQARINRRGEETRIGPQTSYNRQQIWSDTQHCGCFAQNRGKYPPEDWRMQALPHIAAMTLNDIWDVAGKPQHTIACPVDMRHIIVRLVEVSNNLTQ